MVSCPAQHLVTVSCPRTAHPARGSLRQAQVGGMASSARGTRTGGPWSLPHHSGGGGTDTSDILPPARESADRTVDVYTCALMTSAL